MDLQLAGRVALVNAASRGIGRAAAHALAAEGARLVISGRDEAVIAEAAAQIAADTGAEVAGVAGDVSQAGTADRLVAAAVDRFGRLDILVNNSGGPPAGVFADFDDAAWQDAFDLLLLSVVRMVRAALPHLRATAAEERSSTSPRRRSSSPSPA
jgi:3-oxoacyl-[acyl-carrier protein] reductase